VPARSGWPVFRYGRAELEAKITADGGPADGSLEESVSCYRLIAPGTHPALSGYLYAEQAPPDETVP
jgi:hypothetical protein